jgi:thiamine-phosphate pyrophosphorylase
MMMTAAKRHRIKGLYAVTPDTDDTASLLYKSQRILGGGAGILQYRSKSSDQTLKLAQARALQQLCHQAGALFIINDDVALALQLKADGVHLGECDGSLQAARKVLGPDYVIGASCYGNVELARQACRDGVDYLAFGAVHASVSKPEAAVVPLSLFSPSHQLGLPLVAIGGITLENAAAVIAAGADSIAVINALYAAEDPYEAARSLNGLFAV